MAEFSEIKFKGQVQDYSTLKAGLKRSDLNGDAKLQSIFDAIDTANENGLKDGVLDENEIKNFMQKIVEFAKGGRDKNLSSKEANKLLQALGLTNLDETNLFGLLNTFSNQSKNIKQTTKNTQNNSIVIEYTDGHTEEIFQDGSKISTILNENKTTKTRQDKDGKVISKNETSVENGVESIIEYEGETPKSKTVTDTNNNTISRYTLESGEEVLVQEENTQTGDITTYQDGVKTITKKDGTVIVEKDGTTTTTSPDGNTTTVNSENTTVTTVKNPEDNSEIITTNDNAGTTTILNKKDGKNISQTITKDGQTYSVEYDGNGNTKGVTVQNGESPAIIAKKFGCKLEDLIAANQDTIKGKAPNQYFLVGTDIVIPSEISADKFAQLNAGRQTKEQAIGKYNQFVEAKQTQIKAENDELAARKNHKRTFTEQKWNTFEECAKAYYAREGVTNPTKRQIELRVKELQELNPNLKDGEIKGKKITATFNPETDAQIGSRQQKRETAQMASKHKAENATGKKMAQAMYNAIDNQIGGVSEKDFQANLKKVNADNVVGLLKQYNEISPDESLIEAIMDETGNTLNTRRDAVNKIIDALIQRAEKANVSDKRQKQAINACKQELNSYWSLGIGYCQTSKLDGLINNLIGTIDAAEALTNEEKSKTSGNGINETLDLMNTQVAENTSALNKQLAEDGWCADLYEGLKWCVGSNNLDEHVKANLKEYENYIVELQKAEQNAGEAGFKAKFKEIFGVDYDPNLMKGYNKLQSNFAMAQGLTMQKEGFYSEFSSCINGQEDYSSMHNKYGKYLVQLAQAEGQNIDANKAVDIVIAKQLQKQGLDINSATNAQKQQALKTVISNTYNAIDAELNKYTQGRSLSNMEKQLKNAGSAVFGNKKDIAFQVNDYISSQQQGGAAVNMAVKTVGAIAIGVATGGTGFVALATVAGATAALSATVDLTDRVSSEVGLKEDEVTNILKNATIDGASVFAGGMVGKYAAMFKNSNAFIQAGGKMTMMAAGDVSTGAAAEYLQTGTITLEGVAFQAVFSAAGNLVSLKQLAKTNLPQATAGEQAHVRVSKGVKGDVNNHRDIIADGKVAGNADQSHLSANERKIVAKDLEDVPTADELAKYQKENGYEPVSDADKPAYQANQEQVAADYANAHKLENNAVIVEQKVPSVPKEAIDKLNDEIKGIDGAIKRLEQQIAGAKRFGKNTDKLEQQLAVLNQKRLAKAAELDAIHNPKAEGASNNSRDAKEIIETPEVKPETREVKPVDTKESPVVEKAESKPVVEEPVLVKPEAEVKNAVNNINEADIPTTHRNLWNDCKVKVEELIQELKALTPDISNISAKMNTLFSKLDDIAKNTTVDVKVKLTQLKQKISSMFNTVSQNNRVTPARNRNRVTYNSAVEQSQNFNKTHKISEYEIVMDGYKDGGRRLMFDDNGHPINKPSREIIIVDRNKDKELQKIIQNVKKKTAKMSDREKAAFLQKYICKISGNKDIDSITMDNWVSMNTGREIMLGDIITAKPPVAVCRHRSLLFKILGDEVGLNIELQRGNFYSEFGGGGHAWNTVRFEDGTSAIYDAMHNKTSNTTPGHVDDYAKYYFTVNNDDLYSQGLSGNNHVAEKQHINYKDFSNKNVGTTLPKNQGVVISGSETLKLANFELDLGTPEIQAKLKAMKDGDVIFVGREVNGNNDISINDPSKKVSRQHLTIKKSGDKFIITDISTNGTSIGEKLPLINENELVRIAGNNGKPVDARYVKTSREARQLLNDAIESGAYTHSLKSYIKTINKMHVISAQGKSGNDFWYGSVGQGTSDVNPGIIRGEGKPWNYRIDSAIQVEEIAKKYGDPYRVDQNSKVSLKGIPEEFLPTDIAGGRHDYPDGKSLTSHYYKEMHRTANEALQLINNGASERQILEKIAEHYQYAANARPYGQINNSLFMNEINTLLTKAGMKTIPHGILDIASMHLQPETFKKYFIDQYYATCI